MMQKSMTFSPSRLEAFSDGVIAVIITIMVLELKVPAGDGWAAFDGVLPTILTYLLSFVFVGLYWLNHHMLVSRLKRTTTGILWANLFWLFALSLVPFATNYLAEKHDSPFSVELYSLCMLASGATFLALRYAVDCQVQAEEGRASAVGVSLRVKHWGSLGLYAVAALLARHTPVAALFFNAAVAFIWVLPTLGILPAAAQEFMTGPSDPAEE